jgi:hypothetical protein
LGVKAPRTVEVTHEVDDMVRFEAQYIEDRCHNLILPTGFNPSSLLLPKARKNSIGQAATASSRGFSVAISRESPSTIPLKFELS